MTGSKKREKWAVAYQEYIGGPFYDRSHHYSRDNAVKAKLKILAGQPMPGYIFSVVQLSEWPDSRKGETINDFIIWPKRDSDNVVIPCRE